VIALALYMRSSYREVLRCLLEGVQWLLDPSAPVKVAGKSGISLYTAGRRGCQANVVNWGREADTQYRSILDLVR